MAYLYNGKPYKTSSDVVTDVAPLSWDDIKSTVKILDVITPQHDAVTQRADWDGGTLDVAALTYTLSVINRNWYARIGDRDTVQEISENPDEFRTWVVVPVNMLSWIKPGWLYQNGVFSPAEIAHFRAELSKKVESAADEYHRVVLFGSNAESPSKEKKDRFENNLRFAEKHRMGEVGYAEMLQIQLDRQQHRASVGIAAEIWQAMDVDDFADWIIDWQPLTDKAGALIETVRLYGVTQADLLTDPYQATALMKSLKTLADTALGLLMHGKSLTEIRAVIDPMMTSSEA